MKRYVEKFKIQYKVNPGDKGWLDYNNGQVLKTRFTDETPEPQVNRVKVKPFLASTVRLIPMTKTKVKSGRVDIEVCAKAHESRLMKLEDHPDLLGSPIVQWSSSGKGKKWN